MTAIKKCIFLHWQNQKKLAYYFSSWGLWLSPLMPVLRESTANFRLRVQSFSVSINVLMLHSHRQAIWGALWSCSSWEVKYFPTKREGRFPVNQWKPGECTWSSLEEFILTWRTVCSQKLIPRLPCSCQCQRMHLSATSVHYGCHILTSMDFLLPFCYLNEVIHSFLSLSLSFFKRNLFLSICAWDADTLAFPSSVLAELIVQPIVSHG